MSSIKDWDKTKLQKLYNLLSPIPAWSLDLGGSHLPSPPGLLYYSHPLKISLLELPPLDLASLHLGGSGLSSQHSVHFPQHHSFPCS